MGSMQKATGESPAPARSVVLEKTVHGGFRNEYAIKPRIFRWPPYYFHGCSRLDLCHIDRDGLRREHIFYLLLIPNQNQAGVYPNYNTIMKDK